MAKALVSLLSTCCLACMATVEHAKADECLDLQGKIGRCVVEDAMESCLGPEADHCSCFVKQQDQLRPCFGGCWQKIMLIICTRDEYVKHAQPMPCYRTPQGCGDLFARAGPAAQSHQGFECDAVVGSQRSSDGFPGISTRARVQPQLVRDLEHWGLWSERMYDKLMASRGKVTDLKDVPDAVKDRYRTPTGNGDPTSSAGCRVKAPGDPPAGEGIKRAFFSASSKMQGAVAAKIDNRTGLRVSIATTGKNGRILPMSMTEHSMLHSPWVGSNEWPSPDREEYPAFYEARGRRYTVHAGDTLYIPRKWWHWVFSETEVGDPGIAVNVWTNNAHRGVMGCSPLNMTCGEEPELVKGDALSWPAMHKWSVEHFEALEKAGMLEEGDKVEELITSAPTLQKGASLAVGSCAKSDHIYPEMMRRHMRMDGSPDNHMTTFAGLRSALEMLRQGLPQHKGFACHAVAPFDKISTSLWRSPDIHVSQWAFAPSAWAAGRPQANLWVTTGKVTSGLHTDPDYNSLTVLRGTKHVFLFPPDERINLYPPLAEDRL